MNRRETRSRSEAQHKAGGEERKGGSGDGGGGGGSARQSEKEQRKSSSPTTTTGQSPLTPLSSSELDGSRTTDDAPTTNASSSLSATTASAINNDIDDFLARARALGLNLTRQDYERARAGVSAFLRAKRVSSSSIGASNEANGANGEVEGVKTSEKQTYDGKTRASSAAAESKTLPHRSIAPIGTASQHAPPRVNTFQAQSSLSFFTAVEVTQDPAAKSRPRLDDFGALQERRRRKERRRRLRERAEREANDADCEFGSHRCRKAASEPCEDSPLTCVGAEDTPVLPSEDSPALEKTSSALSQQRDFRRKSISLSADALARVGLGISDDLYASSQSQGDAKDAAAAASSRSPRAIMQAWQNDHASSALTHSPGLTKLTRKAHIDSTGRLLLLPSPAKDVDVIMTNVSLGRRCTASGVDEEEEAILANAGGETDDSGVCFTADTVDTASKKGCSQGDEDDAHHVGPRHRRRTSSIDSSTHDLNEGLTKMSFLERIMAQKKSPLRLRKEAKARERQARLAAANNDLIVMTATTASSVPSHSALNAVADMHMTMSASSSSSSSLASSFDALNASANPQSGTNDVSKSVRWASDFANSRKRITTKEMYDFEFYGIAPSQFPQHSVALQGWDGGDIEALRRLTTADVGEDGVQSHHRLRSNFSSTSFGSPVAMRSSSGQHSMIPDSPGLLSLSLNHETPFNASASQSVVAKRGLLFGGGTATPPVAPTSSSLDAVMTDLTNVFSQGPTLARSPARKGMVETETPPRLVRATTLAAPISFAQQAFGREGDVKGKSNDVSPERSTLIRAHSFSTIERQKRANANHAVSLDAQRQDEDKENQTPYASSDVANSSGGRRIPRGWAHRSPASKSTYTISPAAVFGSQQQQQQQQTIQRPRQKITGKPHQAQHERALSGGSTSDQDRRHGQYSASEAEGDDERDMSPIVLMQGKAGGGLSKRGRKDVHGGHARNSSFSASSSAYDESPLVLDTRSSKCAVIVRPMSGSSLAKALDMPSRSSNEKTLGVFDGSAKRKKKDGAGGSVEQSLATDQPFRQSVNEGNVMLPHSMEWDKPDGSRIIKLVSEELQAAMENGALTVEPPSRFYKLPPSWGRSKSKPQAVSYAGMIGQAILSSSDGRLSLNEIYNWISSVFPFFERGDRGWQNSIRHNLSLNKSFIKIERDSSIPGKGGWWAIKSGHEERFQAGNYYAPGTAKAAKENSRSHQKTAKLTTTNNAAAAEGHDDSERGGESNSQSSATARRKRLESNPSEGSDAAASDSDLAASGGHAGKASRRRAKKTKVNRARGPEEAGLHAKPVPVTLLRPEGPSSMLISNSPKQFGTITPSRPYQPGRMAGTSSSDVGSSAYASSIMASLPVLTDASSPPSSPHNGMPPPAGGIRGAASSQSASKQLQASLLGGSGGAPASSSMFGHGLGASTSFVNGSFLQYGLPASPLANMRGGGAAGHGSANARLGVNLAAAAAGAESPLRHSAADVSGSRMMNVNSPVSNVRQTGEQSQTDESDTHGHVQHKPLVGVARSPVRFLHHSPARGSPLRPGGPVHHGGQAGTTSMMSPASSQLQMALGQQHVGNGALSIFGGGGGATSTPITARWGYASPSPSRRMDSLFSPSNAQFATPNVHGHVGTSPTGLDDPFDYSGSLQHEFDMTSELQFTQGEPSPMKGFEHHSFGNRAGVGHGLSFSGATFASANEPNVVSHAFMHAEGNGTRPE